MSPNQYLFTQLAERLQAQGYHVEPATRHLSLMLDGQLELAGAIVDTPGAHPSLMQALLLVLHPVLFPQGIQEFVVGLGDTLEEKVASVLDNFLAATLPPILDGLTDGHHPALDFTAAQGTRWHPLPGPLMQQGRWPRSPDGEPLLALVLEKLRFALPDQPVCWLKIYVAKHGDDLALHCQLNNEEWEDPYPELAAYANAWGSAADFRGLRQFLVLRRCPPAGEQARRPSELP